MEQIFIQYGSVLLVLVLLEGLLSTDNAVVMAVMVKHLPQKEREKALFYGLIGAFIMRFISLFIITSLVKYWEIQAIGAIYLIVMSVKNLINLKKSKNKINTKAEEKQTKENKETGKGFWSTVIKVEITDIAFAIDSMLAAVALGMTLPKLGHLSIGGLNIGQFTVVFAGGIIGLVLIRFAATKLVALLEKYPDLETSAFLIVGWVGIKLVVMTLSHEKVGVLNKNFPESILWQSIFWSVLVLLALGGYIKSIYSNKKKS